MLPMARLTLMILLLLSIALSPSAAQSLSFSRPETLFPDAVSDKAVALIGFHENYTVAWKEPGHTGCILAGTIAQHAGFRVEAKPYRLEQAVSLTAPALQVINNRLYLFWVGTDSSIHYLIHDPEAGFNEAAVHTLMVDKPARFTLGMSTVYSDSLLMIAAHAEKKNRLLFVTCRPDSIGLLMQARVTFVRHAQSDAYPAIALTKPGGAVRLSWADHRTRQLYFCDYMPDSKVWQLPQNYTGVLTERTPAILADGMMKDHFTLMGRGKDNHLWYDMIKEDETEIAAQVLPDYFAAAFRPAVVTVDTSGLIMAYAGTDKQIYFSFAKRYDPSNWMRDILFPAKENYSLKDIVLPGAHDAGMSVLNGIGGQGAAVINECNTLTQVMNIERQLQAGIRMLDLRIDHYTGELFAKHAPSDCMEDAIGGGYGEKLSEILKAVKQFLSDHNQETVILSFCHFCEREMSLKEQAEKISGMLGADKILFVNTRKLGDLKLRDLAGKVIVTFEGHTFEEWGIDANTMINEASDARINYRRCYAATNQLPLLLSAQQLFFKELKGNVQNNDLVRLDWQLTEDSKEAIFICNDFESEKANPLLSGTILLANAIKKSKSIIELGNMGNRYLPGKVMEWIDEGVITKENKPNILYVDVAGNWITDFCIYLNQHTSIYQK
jgi:hypothetical protein